MKRPDQPQSATSLPRAPRDDASARSRRYLIMMAIRMVCFLLMVLITPYGWQTWLFGIAAIVLPYIAVVNANNSEDLGNGAQNPERALPAAAATPKPVPTDSTVIRIEEGKPHGQPESGSDSS
ncbi:DUF3099 domain-containing protein [Microbacterium sp. NPDC076911]|uniref:DUF3099 domain-containing protein n=1 Tax=Microbacterium sp. NPDC076911 TaxID=3154958 RepID=UPI003445E816